MISSDQIETAKSIYSQLTKWNIANSTLSEYFKFNPLNNSEKVILIKVLIIDSLYKTNLKEQISVAENIASISNLDKSLKEGKEEVVEKVAHWQNKNLLSFASKFCHFHNKEKYPIYDKYVIIALKNLLKNWKDDRTFTNFLRGINQFRIENSIRDISYEDLDKFLWMYGMLINLELGKTDINKEIKDFYKNNKELFTNLKSRDSFL